MYFSLPQQRELVAMFGAATKKHPCASRNPPSWCNKPRRKTRSTKKSSAAQKRSRKQAAQAMRIHRRDGVSLKTAWRRVKSGKGGHTRSRTTKRKTTKRKNTQAARAMRMSHREGISLSAAWKRVKRGRSSRFG